MPGRGRGRGRGRRGVARVAARERRIEQEMSPIPHVFVPPMEPPTVRLNRPVRATLDLVIESKLDGIYTITTGSIQNRIKATLGIAEPSFVLEKAEVWGDLTGHHYLTITDFDTGVTGVDEGSYGARPKVGLRYPKNAQRQYIFGASGTTIFSMRVPAVTAPEVPFAIACRVTITTWETTVTLPTDRFRYLRAGPSPSSSSHSLSGSSFLVIHNQPE